jgi:AcrR family transcriptional regulator
MIRIVKKPEVRRQEIVKAARHLFLTKEYDKTTMQSIVEHLGIAKGTIYHYFKFKEELLEAVVEDIVIEDDMRKKLLIKQMQGNALEKIRKLVELDSLAVNNEPLLKTLHQPGNIGMHTRLLAVTLIKEASLYAELIHQGCQEGLFQTDTPLECAEFILSAIQFLTDVGIYPWANEDLLRRSQAFPGIVEALLKAPTGSFKFLLNKFKLVKE